MARSRTNLYSLILGLPEDVENPDHYQILGLPRFTSDEKAIREAAVVQNSKLLKWQNSEYFKESLRLTQQIVEAKQVLENPETRRAYDHQLEEDDPTNDPEELGSILETLDLGTQKTVETRRIPAPRPRDVNPIYTERRNRLKAQREAEKERQEAQQAEQEFQRMILIVVGCLILAFVLGFVFFRISRPGLPAPQADATDGETPAVASAPTDSNPPEPLDAPPDEGRVQPAPGERANSVLTDAKDDEDKEAKSEAISKRMLGNWEGKISIDESDLKKFMTENNVPENAAAGFKAQLEAGVIHFAFREDGTVTTGLNLDGRVNRSDATWNVKNENGNQVEIVITNDEDGSSKLDATFQEDGTVVAKIIPLDSQKGKAPDLTLTLKKVE